MKNKILTALLCSVFFCTLTVTHAFGATTKCKVVKVEDSMVTLDCGANAEDMEEGMDVKVKLAKKKKTIEGC